MHAYMFNMLVKKRYISLWYQDKYLDETPNYIQTWGKIKHQSAFTFLKFCAFWSLLVQKAEKKKIDFTFSTVFKS